MSRAEALRGVPVVSSQHLSKPVAPQTEVPPSPLLGLHAPHSFVTFLLLFSSPQPGKPLLNWLFGAQTCITPLHDQPHPELQLVIDPTALVGQIFEGLVGSVVPKTWGWVFVLLGSAKEGQA